MFPSLEDGKKAAQMLKGQLEASVQIHIVKHPDDKDFHTSAPCYRVTVTAIDPTSGNEEDGPQWRDISPTASPEECTFVVKAEKLAKLLARIFKRKKPRRLKLQIKAEPLDAWRKRYDSLEQTENIKAGDQLSISLPAALRSWSKRP